MLHDIEGTFDNQYRTPEPQPQDTLLVFRAGHLLMARTGDMVELPTIADCLGGLAGKHAPLASQLRCLFSLDGHAYFLASEELAATQPSSAPPGIDVGQVESAESFGGWRFEELGMYRWILPRETRLVVEVASQLDAWYRDNRFCGRCGTRTKPDTIERMLRCPSCGNAIYPRINPGVIVGVIDGEELLLTQYAGRGYTNWALIAGFTEIGESLEQTVEREVLEEVGLRVKNIRYFGNQPWPRSSSLLVGFFAELDGPREVSLDDAELARAAWTHWRDVPHEPDDYSLTRTMMCAFHDGFA